MTATNVGKWDQWYSTLVGTPRPYAETATYKMGADWLAPCSLIEDWGCGGGWMRQFVSPDRYRGVDGSQTPFADVIADLTTYRSHVPGVFMRHVLEHNYEWARVLDGALASAQDRVCVVLFTPLADTTHTIAFADDPGVPDISFRLSDLTDRIKAAGFSVGALALPTATQYGTETLLYLERCSVA